MAARPFFLVSVCGCMTSVSPSFVALVSLWAVVYAHPMMMMIIISSSSSSTIVVLYGDAGKMDLAWIQARAVVVGAVCLPSSTFARLRSAFVWLSFSLRSAFAVLRYPSPAFIGLHRPSRVLTGLR